MAKAKQARRTAGEVVCWRLCREQHAESPLDGVGAQLYGGRWNHRGLPMVYASATLSLAVLETLVHVDQDLAPTDRVAVRITIPSSMKIEAIDEKDLPKGWRGFPTPETLRNLGVEWLRARRTPVLRVPSAIVPQESNYLINPLHADAAKVKWALEPFGFDQRLFQ